MTVELRTNPPLVMLRIKWDDAGSPQVDTLHSDPFGEKKKAEKSNAAVLAKMPTFDTDAPFDPHKYAKWQQDLETWNNKFHSATSVFIDGLDERRMAQFIRAFNGNPDAAIANNATFKGTRFRKVDKSQCSIVARCLKEGLGTHVVKIGVKMSWDPIDIVRYGVAIRDTLAKAGIAQPTTGYTGAPTGQVQGAH